MLAIAAIPFTGPFTWAILGIVVLGAIIVAAAMIWVVWLSVRQKRS